MKKGTTLCQSVGPKRANKLPTPINVSKLAIWLKGYPIDKAQFLISGFTQGFALNFTGKRDAQDSPNHASALQNPDIVTQKIHKELLAGRIAGPFHTKPDNLKVSPLGLIPKKTHGFRIIHNLSFSPNTDQPSVNEGIPHEACTVHYAGIDDAIAKVKRIGRGCWMARSDIENAFKIIPIRPEDYMLQGFSWRGMYYYDKTLVMGCSISCRIFEAFSTALEWILVEKFKINTVIHILDDVIFIENSELECQAALDKFLWLCAQLEVPIAFEKTLGPAQILTFVGITLDSIKMETRLPKDKVDKAIGLLHKYSKKRTITLQQLQSLLGFLSFCCKVVQPGRCFLRRLTNLTIGVSNPRHWITLKASGRADLAAWLQFLKTFNRATMFIREIWLSNNILHLYTDAAAASGFGAVLGTRWLHGAFPAKWKILNITFLELYPIAIAVAIWGHLLKNHSIMFHTDNAALVFVINKQSSSHPHIMHALRQLIIACMRYNINFRAQHIPGQFNQISDALSRFHLQKFRALAPHCQPVPTAIPQYLQPDSFLPPCQL